MAPLLIDTDALARWLDGTTRAADLPSAISIVDARGRPVRASFVFGSNPYAVE